MHSRYYLGAAATAAIICGLGGDMSGASIAWAKSGSHKVQSHRHAHSAKARPGKPPVEKAAHNKAGHDKGFHDGAANAHPRVAERFAALQAPLPDMGAAQPSEEERRAKLRQALEARAQAIAVAQIDTTGSLAAALPASGAAAPAIAQPRSVSFDFESGLKTTTFPGDRIVREGFDVAAAKALASTPPGQASLLPPRQ